jgi:hypothetical protein
MDDSAQVVSAAVTCREKANLTLAKIVERTKVELDKIEGDREALEKEVQEWEKQNQKLTAEEIGDVINLNVGGTQFTFSIETLS